MADKEVKVKVICSVAPGFEQIALNECKDKLKCECEKELRGRFSVTITIKEIHRLSELRAVNHFWVIVKEIETPFKSIENDEKSIQEYLDNLAAELNWENGLLAWKTYKIFEKSRPLNPSVKRKPKMESDVQDVEEIPLNYVAIDPLTAGQALAFRVTTQRTGKHIFGSPFVDRYFGSGVQDLFNWKVDLTNFNIKVVVHVLDDSISVGIQLTEDCQALRNLTHFGPTNLRANISYGLLKLANTKPGDIVCDPMCGGGSISLEGAVGIPGTFHVAGDNHEKAVENASDNYTALSKLNKTENSTLPMSVLRMDVYHIPLRTACIDRIVTDLPFGKKSGNKERNMFLYPNALYEMARICRPKGKAVLLTQHKKALWKALMICKLWSMEYCTKINMGGMNISVYVLGRTKDKFTPRSLKTTEGVKARHNPRVKKNEEFLKNNINENLDKLHIENKDCENKQQNDLIKEIETLN